MKKHLFNVALLCSFLMVCATGVAQKSAKIITNVGNNLFLNGMSPNGKWAVLYAGSQLTYFNPTLWNLETDETTLLYGPEDTESSQILAIDVDDNGMAVGSYDNMPAYYKDGQWIQLPVPEGYTDGSVKSVCADGSIMVGYVNETIDDGTGGVDYIGKACKWVNGQLVDDVYIPETDSRKVKVVTPQFVEVSTDGSTIMGVLNFTYLTSCTPVIWAPEEPQTICDDLYYNEDGKRNYTALHGIIGMSPNGKYVTGYIDYDLGETNTDGNFLYDVQSKKSKVYTGDNNEIITQGCAIDNDGVIYEATTVATAVRNAYIRVNEIQHDMTEYMKEEYNFDLTAETSMQNFGTVMAVSDDGKTVIGFEGPGGNWCLKYSVAPGANESAIDSNETTDVTVLMNGKNLIVEGNAENVTISDLTGKTVLNQPLSGSTINLGALPQGIYVATVTSEGQNIVKKIAVK